MADAEDLKSSGVLPHGGSNPPPGTIFESIENENPSPGHPTDQMSAPAPSPLRRVVYTSPRVGPGQQDFIKAKSMKPRWCICALLTSLCAGTLTAAPKATPDRPAIHDAAIVYVAPTKENYLDRKSVV